MSIKRTVTWKCDFCDGMTEVDPTGNIGLVQPEGWIGVAFFTVGPRS